MIIVTYTIVCISRVGMQAANNVIAPGMNIITGLYYPTGISIFKDALQCA